MSCHPASRREMLALLGAGALIPRWTHAAETSLHFEAVDHVGITVSDPQKSAAFYARIFGGAVYKNNKSTQRYLKLGPTYISIRQSGPQSKGYRRGSHLPRHSFVRQRGGEGRTAGEGRRRA